jgi:hypothetical protein
MTREQELDVLKSQSEYLEQALDDLKKRIQETGASVEGSKTK